MFQGLGDLCVDPGPFIDHQTGSKVEDGMTLWFIFTQSYVTHFKIIRNRHFKQY